MYTLTFAQDPDEWNNMKSFMRLQEDETLLIPVNTYRKNHWVALARHGRRWYYLNSMHERKEPRQRKLYPCDANAMIVIRTIEFLLGNWPPTVDPCQHVFLFPQQEAEWECAIYVVIALFRLYRYQ